MAGWGLRANPAVGRPQPPALSAAARRQSPEAAGPATLPGVPHIRAAAGGSGRDAISLFLCRKRRAGAGPFLRAWPWHGQR